MLDNLNNIIKPSQPPIEAESDVHVVKSRLEWGEPAFTMVDVSERSIYNQGHIIGAMPIPLDQLRDIALESLDKERDIYVYGVNEGQTAQAAQILRSAGFTNVSELKGGFAAWKEIGGLTEGVVESRVTHN